MEAEFWHGRWQRNELGWHNAEAHPMLVEHLSALDLEPGSRVFVPFCGKTRDVAWLLSNGFRVAAAELSELAIRQLFAELDLVPEVSEARELLHYRGPGLDVFVGDFFELSREVLGPVDAVYDRAALVALPPEMRRTYARNLVGVTQAAPQLLITFEYDQEAMGGPPFAVSADEVYELYGARYETQLLERAAVPGGLKGQCEADECAWLLMAG